ncbi:MAG: flavodoxin family protein [Phycisphaerae bacterium]|nr:flavodoxin family protein [Phycisphaerae bacterium]
MKVLAINGSPRKGGNTEILINKVFEPLQAAGIETELVQIGGQAVRGCTACMKCFKTNDKTCIIKNDPVNDIIAKMIEADGIIFGSPTYFADVTAELKALIDRAGLVCYPKGHLKHKVAASVVAVRRGGSIHAFDTMNHFFQINSMFIVGSSYWNMVYGREPGEVESDEEGIRNMTNLGESMALLLQKLNA